MPVKTSYAHGDFCWVDLMAHDVEGAKKFYGGLFGWKADVEDTQGGPPYFTFSLNGKHIAGLGEMNADMKGQGIPPIWRSYINVTNVADTVTKAQQLGGNMMMPPMPVMEHGHMAIIGDPTGAAVSLWQKNQHIGAQLRDEPGAFCWNELMTRDAKKAKDFFGKLLGWEFQDYAGTPSEYYIIMNRGQPNGGVMQITPDMGELPPHWMVYFTMTDADAAAEKAKKLGGSICHGPFDVSVGRIVILNDPQGGVFSVIKMNAT
jgi:predicted enzyme related to lactoylglutathione lyase